MLTTPNNAKKGQILVLMAMLATTLAILMGMVVSVGHLVQSKINLQNAVDLSAMSGASWQARYQNALSVVNYRMRQNYKWLLFDVYVTQSRFNGEFRDKVDGGSGYINQPEKVFAICQQSFGYQPVRDIGETGRGTNDSTDMCKNALAGGFSIPPIVPSAAPAYNPIYISINEAIKRLGQEAQAICRESAGQNRAYLQWTTNRTADNNRFQADQFRQLQQDFRQAFGGGGPGTLVSPSGPIADQTSYATFTGSLMASHLVRSPELSWITPLANRSAPTYSSNSARLFMNYVNFEVTSAGGCFVKIEGLEGASTPVGFSREMKSANRRIPEVPLNVVLSGKTQPNILFWPQGVMPQMVAIGGAKAFGSRVGPPDRYFRQETFDGKAGLVNINFYPNDLTSRARGMFNVDILQAALRLLPARYSGRNPLRPTESFMPLVNSPTRYEALYYNSFAVTQGAAGDMFPETLVPPINRLPDYELKDREVSANPEDVGFHERQLFGLGQFYARRPATLSSWAPLYEANGNINPQLASSIGRQGYQIKLTSIKKICEEMGVSSSGGGSGIDALCGGALELHH